EVNANAAPLAPALVNNVFDVFSFCHKFLILGLNRIKIGHVLKRSKCACQNFPNVIIMDRTCIGTKGSP
ncbi:MAG: hypothetical protein AB7U43_04765, partial [Desulfobacter sp.]